MCRKKRFQARLISTAIRTPTLRQAASCQQPEHGGSGRCRPGPPPRRLRGAKWVWSEVGVPALLRQATAHCFDGGGFKGWRIRQAQWVAERPRRVFAPSAFQAGNVRKVRSGSAGASRQASKSIQSPVVSTGNAPAEPRIIAFVVLAARARARAKPSVAAAAIVTTRDTRVPA